MSIFNTLSALGNTMQNNLYQLKPMPVKPNKRSYWEKTNHRLKGVNPILQDVINDAYNAGLPFDINIAQGLRSIEEQRKAVAGGFSKTMNSKHLTGNAVDIYPVIDGKVIMDASHPAFAQLHNALIPHFKNRVGDLDKGWSWGGVWGKEAGSRVPVGKGWDLPHYEITSDSYKYDPNNQLNYVYKPYQSNNTVQPQQPDTMFNLGNTLSNAISALQIKPQNTVPVVNNTIPVQMKTNTKIPSVTALALDTIKGKYGNGDLRKARLTEAGYNYSDVQKEVNRLLKVKR